MNRLSPVLFDDHGPRAVLDRQLAVAQGLPGSYHGAYWEAAVHSFQSMALDAVR